MLFSAVLLESMFIELCTTCSSLYVCNHGYLRCVCCCLDCFVVYLFICFSSGTESDEIHLHGAKEEVPKGPSFFG